MNARVRNITLQVMANVSYVAAGGLAVSDKVPGWAWLVALFFGGFFMSLFVDGVTARERERIAGQLRDKAAEMRRRAR